jgi:hypothetical protein
VRFLCLAGFLCTQSNPISSTFRGGLEILFANVRKLQLSIQSKQDDGKRPNIAWLIGHLVKHEMKDKRTELFVLDGHV